MKKTPGMPELHTSNQLGRALYRGGHTVMISCSSNTGNIMRGVDHMGQGEDTSSAVTITILQSSYVPIKQHFKM